MSPAITREPDRYLAGSIARTASAESPSTIAYAPWSPVGHVQKYSCPLKAAGRPPIASYSSYRAWHSSGSCRLWIRNWGIAILLSRAGDRRHASSIERAALPDIRVAHGVKEERCPD